MRSFYLTKAICPLLFLVFSHTSFAQFDNLLDQNTFAMFCNSTTLPIDIHTRVSGLSSRVTMGKQHYLPWEVSNAHDFGDQVTAIILGIVFSVDPNHSDRVFMSRSDRTNDFFANESFVVYHDVIHNGDTLFTMVLQFKDQANSLNASLYYDIIYRDGSADVPLPGVKLNDNTGNHPREATRTIMIHGKAYKLLYGSYDTESDPTDNVLFSLSELQPDNVFQQTPDAADLLNPNVLNVWSYNPGMLRPLDYNDNEEAARAQVMHLAIPDNLDIIIFQEMFEKNLNKIMFDSLKTRYPYYTTTHNQPRIPNIGKDGGVRIMSAHPILEVDEISYQYNNCIPEDIFSFLADKGVQYAKINKHGQIIHVFGTHTSEQPCDLYVMGEFMTRFDIRKEDIVVLAGDYNVTLEQFESPGFNIYQATLDTTHAIEPTYLSLAWDRPYRGTCWGICHYYGENAEGTSFIDYVMTSKEGKLPIKMENTTQVARVHNTHRDFWGVFDLGDHNPVYGRMEFPYITVSASDTLVCPGGSFQLTAQTNLDNPVFEWYKNDSLIQTSVTPALDIVNYDGASHFSCKAHYSYQPDTSINKLSVEDEPHGPYIYRGRFESFISDDVQIRNCVPTGIRNNTVQQLSIFPNPAKNVFQVEWPPSVRQNELWHLKLFSADGAMVLERKLLAHDKIEIVNLEAGVYFAEISIPGSIIYANKLVIIH